MYFLLFFVVFFFKQKTAYEMRISDWSSDVCSSDLRMVLTLTPVRLASSPIISIAMKLDPPVDGGCSRCPCESNHEDGGMNQMNFTPALGRTEMTGAYDLAIRLLTRERGWRSALLQQLAPSDGDAILDSGCGTWTFSLLVKA